MLYAKILCRILCHFWPEYTFTPELMLHNKIPKSPREVIRMACQNIHCVKPITHICKIEKTLPYKYSGYRFTEKMCTIRRKRSFNARALCYSNSSPSIMCYSYHNTLCYALTLFHHIVHELLCNRMHGCIGNDFASDICSSL